MQAGRRARKRYLGLFMGVLWCQKVDGLGEVLGLNGNFRRRKFLKIAVQHTREELREDLYWGLWL
jgi:hypothetical protein